MPCPDRHAPASGTTPGRRRWPPVGATLIELVLALALAAALVMAAVPVWRGWLATLRLLGQAHALAGTMNHARSEAMKNGNRATICRSPDGVMCADAGGWEQGWILFEDADGDGERGPDEAVIRHEPAAPPGIRMAANAPIADYISYTSYGHARRTNGALQMGTIRACLAGTREILIVLAHSGRIRVERTDVECG
jgi:type IV fimbrial biogenesis protein FimT